MAYVLLRNGTAFGDNLLALWMVRVLNEHGVEVYFRHQQGMDLSRYMDVPLHRGQPVKGIWEYTYVRAYEDYLKQPRSLMEWCLADFKAKFGLKVETPFEPRIPVKFVEDPTVGHHDVAINFSAGPWVRFRNWPHFPQLVRLLKAHGISFVLLDESMKDHKCLTAVKRAKVYLGLETGVSHYVSSVVNKGLVLQSGFTKNDFWNMWGYEYLEYSVPCAPCHIRPAPTGRECPHGIKCMQELSPETVLKKLLSML